MTAQQEFRKVGESSFFFVDIRDYLVPVIQFDPVLANQTVVFEPEPVEEPQPIPEEEQQRGQMEPSAFT